ncbi:MAG: cation-translocating P-type ATPase [Candidatus Binatus sp.]|nr:cation-translocating P-type ATPase [Candidatus Binatus sp.]MDO8432620.1 cation-translocating P-type ATPase [Candidatus Binatus sp.]
MFQLLIAAGSVYLLLGSFGEAIVLLASAAITVTVAIVQESRTERVLEALRDLSSPRALVVRDGVRKRIAGREVVRGDTIILTDGDRVPADAILTVSHDLQADESLLTGESVPVRKTAARDTPSSTRLGGDDLPFVFSGSLIVRGQGVAEVYATGSATEIGKIGTTLIDIREEPTPLRAQTRRLVRVLATVGISISVVTIILYRLLRGSWLDGLLAGIALAMSIIPEEFPLVLTIFLVMGAWRISKARVLARRSAAIETLGAASVLCTDKTGTLTLNQMSIAALRVGDELLLMAAMEPRHLPDKFRTLLEYGILASEIDPFDPLEKAFHALGQQSFSTAEHIHLDWSLVHEYGLTPQLFVMSHVWKAAGQRDYIVAAKGAPESIGELCHLDSAELGKMLQAADQMASQGMRVLGVARAVFPGTAWPQSQRDFDFEFLGLAGLADPIRPTVPQAVRECREAGIAVVMVTGDYPVTARAIAEQAGLDVSGGAITGEQVARMTDTELGECVQSAAIFARITPDQKLRIVNAFKANGAVVAMTGDGVNDAPSLKAAHIGVAMGGRGTDVAREAAALVLLDDDFGSIVKAIRLGRRIYDNLRKAMGYLLSVHVPITGLALLPLFLGWPLVLSPVHIAFLELVIDPVSSIVFEAEVEEGDVMRRRPRDPGMPLFSPALIGRSLLQGTVVLMLTAGVFMGSMLHRMPEEEVRALTFASLVAGNFGLVLVNRSFTPSIHAALGRPNRALWIVLGSAVLLLAITLTVPSAMTVFHFGDLHAHDLMVVLAVAAATVSILELLKGVSSSVSRRSQRI